MRLLVTRPQPGAGDTARRLAALGHDAIVDPMLRVAQTHAPLPTGDFTAIAFTSVNGVKALDGHAEKIRVRHLPAFAVGSRTAQAARAAGFADVTDCAGDVIALGAALKALPPGSRVLHAAGAERAGDLEGDLAPADISLALAVLYRTLPADQLAPETIAALKSGAVAAALHYSARTVESLLEATARGDVTGPFLALRQLCLSHAVAAPLRALGATTEVSQTPDEDALLTLL